MDCLLDFNTIMSILFNTILDYLSFILQKLLSYYFQRKHKSREISAKKEICKK